jgi:hypothetical protein
VAASDTGGGGGSGAFKCRALGAFPPPGPASLSDAAELVIDANAREVIAGWRATARIKADRRLYAQAMTPTEGDFGPVETLT